MRNLSDGKFSNDTFPLGEEAGEKGGELLEAARLISESNKQNTGRHGRSG